MRKLLNSKMKSHIHEHKNIIEVKNYNFSYGRKTKQLQNLSFEIHRGEWTTIIGPNGSGKSTFAKNLAKILKSKSGTIKLEDKNIHDYKNKEYARKVSYIPQIIEIPEGTSVYDYISYGRNPWLGFTATLSKVDKKIIETAMKKTGTWRWRDKMTEDLSGGQRQKVVVALALAQDADVILLDEPTTYLDIRAQYELLELLAEAHSEGKTIISILHDINQAVQYSDEIIIFHNGKIHSVGHPKKVVTKKMLAEVYGVHTNLSIADELKYITDVRLYEYAEDGISFTKSIKNSNMLSGHKK